jgi:hypothetical protein
MEKHVKEKIGKSFEALPPPPKKKPILFEKHKGN